MTVGEARCCLGKRRRSIGLTSVHGALVLDGYAHRELFRHLIAGLETCLKVGKVGDSFPNIGGTERQICCTDADVCGFKHLGIHDGDAALY